MSLAKRILAGQGYENKHWQPGFPFLLAGLLWLFGLSFVWLKLVIVTLGVATAFISIRMFQAVGAGRTAPVLAALVAAAPLYFDFSHRLMSEIPFLACAVLALVCLCEVQQPATPRRRLIASILLPIAASAAVAMRGNGLAIAVALAAALPGVRRSENGTRLTVAVAFLASVLTFAAWTAWGATHRLSGITNVTYLEEVQVEDNSMRRLWEAGGFTSAVPRVTAGGFASRVYRNLIWHQLYNAAGVFWPGASTLAQLDTLRLGTLVAFVLLLPAVFGLFLWRLSPPLWAYLLMTLGLVVVYPTGGSGRMLLPAVPVLIAAYYVGLRRWLRDDHLHRLAIALLVGNTVLCTIQAIGQARTPIPARRPQT